MRHSIFPQACIIAALLMVAPAYSQSYTSYVQTGAAPVDSDQMLVPPPVSGDAYPTTFGTAMRSNYLRAGLIASSGYGDNMLETTNGIPVDDVIYTIWPTITIDKAAPRSRLTFTYSPGFTIYQHASSDDQTSQDLTFAAGYRLSPHIMASINEGFVKTSNVLNQPNALSAGVLGSAQPPTAAIIVPFANQLSNTLRPEVTYQFGVNDMVGAQGTLTTLRYANLSSLSGLYDSDSRGGSGFYNHRLSTRQYIGVSYQYLQMVSSASSLRSDAQTHAGVLFYTTYLKPGLSLSLSGGAQRLSVNQTSLPVYSSWAPETMASLGWQTRRTNFAVSYSRMVTGGGGLVGASIANGVSASARWLMERTWSVGAVSSYGIYRNALPAAFLSSPGGYSLYGTVSVQHILTPRFTMDLGYTRVSQSYGYLTADSRIPNTQRAYVSFAYQLARPLGR